MKLFFSSVVAILIVVFLGLATGVRSEDSVAGPRKEGSAAPEAGETAYSKRRLWEALDELRMNGVKEKSLKVGAVVSPFVLPDAQGNSFESTRHLKTGPLVVVFYRGGWCPYCNLHLRTLQQSLKEFEKYHAQLVAISPQSPDNSLTTTQKNALSFAVLSDAGSKVASTFGITFVFSEKLQQLYRESGIDLEQLNASKDWALPLPATYVIDRDGTVAYAFVEEDYQRQAQPSEIIGALKYLSEGDGRRRKQS